VQVELLLQLVEDGVLGLVDAHPDEAVVVARQHLADLVERDVAQLAACVVGGRVDHAGWKLRLVVGRVGCGRHARIVPPPPGCGKQLAAGRALAMPVTYACARRPGRPSASHRPAWTGSSSAIHCALRCGSVGSHSRNSATTVHAATTPSQRPNQGPAARPRTMRQPPGSSSRHSGLNSSRLWLAQPKRCAVKNQMNSISAPTRTHSPQNGSATPATTRGARRAASVAATAIATPASI